MTEFQIASAIENYVTSHHGVTNSPFSKDQIRDEVDTVRERLIEDAEKEHRGFFNYEPFEQRLSLTLPEKLNGKYKLQIPRVFSKINGKPAIKVFSAKGNVEFRMVYGTHFRSVKSDPFLSNVPIASYNNEVLELYNTSKDDIIIEAIFSKPSSLELFNQYDHRTSPYPASGAIIDKIIGKTAESYIRTQYRIPVQPNTQSDTIINR